MFITSSGSLLIEMGLLYLHLCTELRISENSLSCCTKWFMFVSVCVFLGRGAMAFIISKRDAGLQKFNIDSNDNLFAFFGPRICILLLISLGRFVVICFMLVETGPLRTSSSQGLLSTPRNGKPRHNLP